MAEDIRQLSERIRRGGPPRYHESARRQGKLFARERLARLLDPGYQVEDGLLANNRDPELPADGVVTVTGQIEGRTVCVLANDSTVKAGSWGWRTVEKILRLQETALRMRAPIIYLVDSAGARITDQIQMFPGRRGAGRIFFNQARLSGYVPQVCLLLGPSAAGGAYIPSFCDFVGMVEGNASMYLGSPRMAEMVIGEKVTLEEMGGARMHCAVSGSGDLLAASEEEGLDAVKRYLGYFPQSYAEQPPAAPPREPLPGPALAGLIPENQNQPFDMYKLVERLVDQDSLFELKRLYAPEVITALARLEGRPVGIIANQPKVKGGVLFVESAAKATRFIWLCDAFNIPLLFLADVPGFMIGAKVEREGIIRAGAKMIAAVSEATVPKLSVVVRKCYGAGLYAMCGPAFEPEACLALPTAKIAVMGPEAAINAVYYNRIQEMAEPERSRWVAEQRALYEKDIDIYNLAGELVVDAVVHPDDLRAELVARLQVAGAKRAAPFEKKRPVNPM
ncbi:MAG: acyl-CoA carboxylase subunit beta [Chloroflexi bacterium]|nr:acyl-CoA carboxylase subunit beta [Chloroflexota bacterium]